MLKHNLSKKLKKLKLKPKTFVQSVTFSLQVNFEFLSLILTEVIIFSTVITGFVLFPSLSYDFASWVGSLVLAYNGQ